MPIWFDAAGIVLGLAILASAIDRGRWRSVLLGLAIFGLACFALGGNLS